MKRFLVLAAASLFAVTTAQVAMASAQQDKMKTCNKEATGKKGEERKAFIKECLSGGATANNSPVKAACEEKAVGKNGKPLAGAAKNAFMKKCQKDSAPQ